MFVSKEFHRQLVKAETEANVLREQNKVLQTELDYAKMRMNQLEKERAILLYQASDSKIKVPTPEFVRPEALDPYAHMTTLPTFDDLNDEEAAKLGIGWNPDGTIKYDLPKREGN